jgi:outer membrane protein OmpA-like peptidoglycan-associated protein/tetratricopeptide (TPR) repeat protein
MIRYSYILIVLLFAALSSCTYTEKVRDGQTAIEVKQYAVALELLQKEYEKSKSRVEKGRIAYKIGEAYKNLNQSDLAIRWYKIAYDNQYGWESLREYAFALKQAERYDEAARAFKDLGIEIGSPYEYRREISACQIAQGWKDLRPEYEVEVMGFNSSRAEYAPVLYKSNQLVITSDRANSTGDDTYNWTGNAFSDLFLVDLESNTVSDFTGPLNTEDNEGTAIFNSDYTEVYFTRCFGGGKWDADHCKIMRSEVSGNSWSIPQPLSFMQEGVNYGGPALSEDGQRLYFSADHPDGWGGHDLYYSERQTDGTWGPPQLMTRVINTEADEMFPFVDKDTLYFSSRGHTGMGGLDIFKTYQLQSRGWASPYNLKPPVNSGSDDFGYIIDYSAPKQDEDVLYSGYFTSRREEGIGNDDIYRFTKRKLPPEEVVQDEEPPKEIEYKLLLKGFVLEKLYEVPTDPNSVVLGRKPLPGSTVKIQFGPRKEEVTVGEDGMFELELEEEADYTFLAAKEGYLKNDAAFSTRGIGRDPNNPVQEFEIEIVLDRIFLDKEIRLENIYYDFDKANIREDAQPTLNDLARNLELNPDIRIQLGSHTDCRGSSRYNQDLAQRRAQAAVDYLISQGIDPGQLVAFGYGESEPEADCICNRCTEEEHQINRRTTFKIIE